MVQTCATNIGLQQKLSQTISNKLKSEFKATTIYDRQEFLEVSLQNSITQYTAETNDRFTDWAGRLKNFFGSVNTAYDRVISEKPEDLLEIATECIFHRMLKEENAQYDSLFLNKNFLGEHFLTPRTNEEAIFEKCLKHWDNGFHKSILIVGDNLSGKTTFINKAVKKSLRKEVLFVMPNSSISYRGRKFKTTKEVKEVKEVLREIKKSSYNSKPIVVIDHLEFWHDQEFTLLDNVRAIIKFIESESDAILVVISVSSLMQTHLDKRLPFSSSFSTHIDLNYSTTPEIFEAVRLRHGASHRKLVDEKEEQISPLQFERLVQRLAKRCDNNLGEVLQAWTYGTNLASDNMILYDESSLYFPDFFTNEEAILVKYALLYRTIDERTLKGFLGKRYGSGYESGLKRLSNTKVFVRDASGFLSLNPVIFNEAKKILNYRGIFK
ncbi:MAG: hypothetical protein WA810_00625 [Maribacter sp.]